MYDGTDTYVGTVDDIVQYEPKSTKHYQRALAEGRNKEDDKTEHEMKGMGDFQSSE